MNLTLRNSFYQELHVETIQDMSLSEFDTLGFCVSMIDKKSRHRRIKKQRRCRRLAAASQWYPCGSPFSGGDGWGHHEDDAML